MARLRMMRAPQKYVQGRDALFKFYDEMKDLGDKWLFICSRSGHKMCHDKIERSFEGTDDVRYYEIFGGISSTGEIEKMRKIVNTINLVLPSYVTAFMLAILLGLLAGYKKDGWIDKIINGAASVGLAVPTFWVALLVIYKFGCDLKWFPIVGMHTIGDESFGDFIMHFIMPYSVLIIGFLPDLVRYVRSSTITQLSEDYVLVQKAFGSNKMEILFKHVSRNVLLPLITKLGMSLPMLVTGAVITETIFSWPGIGSYFVNAINKMDYPIVMDILLLSGTLVILGNLLSDILCALVDPRIRVEGE